MASTNRRCCRSEGGTSPISAVLSLAILLAFLLVAAQVTLHLFATSVVSAAAFDAARYGATAGRGCSEGASNVEGVARARLGPVGRGPDVDVRCAERGGTIHVRIVAPSPGRAAAVTVPTTPPRINRAAVMPREIRP